MPEAASPEPGEDEDLTVNLDADAAPDKDDKTEQKPAVTKPPPVPGPGSAPSEPMVPQAGLDALKAQVETVRRERDQHAAVARRVQQERDQWAAYAQEAERRGVTALEVYADSKIQGINDQMEALAGRFEAAMTEGDFKTAAQVQLKLNRLGGDMALAERDKNIAMQQREQMQRRGQQQPQQRQQQPQPQQQQLPSDPMERAMIGRSEPAKAFLRKHPELVRSDGSLKRSAIDAHERSLDEGYTEGSHEYFANIEKILGSDKAPPQGAEERPHPGYAAPVERGSPPGGSSPVGPDGRFTLTPNMRRLAAEAGVSPQEWAAQYVRLLNEGRVTPIK